MYLADLVLPSALRTIPAFLMVWRRFVAFTLSCSSVSPFPSLDARTSATSERVT